MLLLIASIGLAAASPSADPYLSRPSNRPTGGRICRVDWTRPHTRQRVCRTPAEWSDIDASQGRRPVGATFRPFGLVGRQGLY